MLVVINTQYGDFSLSDEALELYCERKGITDPDFWYGGFKRHDPVLVSIVQELGEAANGSCATLKIVEIPIEEYLIEECDGNEWIAEPHRTWR